MEQNQLNALGLAGLQLNFHRAVGWCWSRGMEGTQPGELTQTDQRAVTYTHTCSYICLLKQPLHPASQEVVGHCHADGKQRIKTFFFWSFSNLLPHMAFAFSLKCLHLTHEFFILFSLQHLIYFLITRKNIQKVSTEINQCHTSTQCHNARGLFHLHYKILSMLKKQL